MEDINMITEDELQNGIPIVCSVHGVEIGRTYEGFVLGEHQYVAEGKIVDTSGCILCPIDHCDLVCK